MLVYVAPELVNGAVAQNSSASDAPQTQTPPPPEKVDPGSYGKMNCETLKFVQQGERTALKSAQIESAASAIRCDLAAPRVDPSAYGKMNCKALKSQYPKIQAKIKADAPADKLNMAAAVKLTQIESAAASKSCAL